MKIRITDLMDLYEDKNCPLSPVSEPENDVSCGAHCAPRQEGSQGPRDIKASRHAFGWKQALTLAAVLALVVLGGFAVKHLLSWEPAQPGQTGATEWNHQETNDVVWLGWDPISGEEQEALSRFLTGFAQQGVESMEDLDEDAELIRFAFIYRRIYDPESIPVQRNDDGELWDTLSPEQVNETLQKLLGKTVTPTDGAEYSLLRSDPVGGHCSFHDGYFWQEPSGEDHLLRFALATHVLNDRDGSRLEVLFTTYEVRLLYWGSEDLYPLPGLSTEAVEALVQESKLNPLGQCVAELRETGDSYQLLDLTPQSTEPEPVDPESSDSTAEDTPEELHTTPTGFDSVSDEDWECFNSHLTNAARYGFPEIDENGDFASTDVEFPNCFAQASALTDRDGDSYAVCFEVYEAEPERWPEFLSLNPALIEDLSELLEAGKIRVVGSGAASFRKQNGVILLTGYSVSSLQTKPEPAEDPALRAEIEALFADEMSWYSRALLSQFAKPKDVDLFQLFYAGIPEEYGPLTAEEKVALTTALGFDPETVTTCNRLPKAVIDEILLQIFGLRLEDAAGRGAEKFDALLDDCWYHIHGDTNTMPVHIREIREQADGTVLATYCHNWPPYLSAEAAQTWTVALYPYGDGGWIIRSNLPGEWNSRNSAGALSALYETDTVWFAETRDEAGTGTARELTLRTDGSFSYREGDLNSEYCLYQEGAWWLDGADTLRLRLWDDSYTDWDRPENYQVDIIGAPPTGNGSTLPQFTCTMTGNELTLTQITRDGFAEDPVGTVIRFEQRSASGEN